MKQTHTLKLKNSHSKTSNSFRSMHYDSAFPLFSKRLYIVIILGRSLFHLDELPIKTDLKLPSFQMITVKTFITFPLVVTKGRNDGNTYCVLNVKKPGEPFCMSNVIKY